MTQNLSILTDLLTKTRSLGADAADAVMFETVEISASRRMGKPEGLERSENRAIGLRAFCKDGQAIVSATDLRESALAELAERAVSMARATPPDPDSRLAEASQHPSSLPELDLYDGREPDIGWLESQCARAEDAALSVPGITNSEGASAHYSSSRVSLATSNGGSFAKSYETSHFSVSACVLAGSGVDMQRDYEFANSHHREDIPDASEIGLKAARRTLARLNPRKIKTCKVPVIFDPRVSRSFLSVLATAISGASIARGSSFLKDEMGKQVFAAGVTVIDDPHIRRGLGSRPFDAEGVKNRKLELVKNGTLKSWLLDLRTASKLKLATTGHASRGLATAPSPSATNLYMQPGTISPKDLFRETGMGLYVTETSGMGINPVTGDYSQGASGFWIENGEIAYPVSGITIAGRLQDMFAGITPANDLEFRYATNAPTLRVETMTVAGT